MSAPDPVTAPPHHILQRLRRLRDEFAQRASRGMFTEAAAREWLALPHQWRMALVLLAGIGNDKDDLADLASRSWQAFPLAERQQVHSVVRSAKRHLCRLMALSAKVQK